MPRGLDVHGAACVRGAARKGGGQGVVTHVQLLQFVNHGWVGEQRGQARQAAPKAVGGIAACSRPRSKRSRRRGEGVLGTPGQRTHGNLAGTWAASWVRGPGRLTWEPGQNLVDARENEVPGSLEALRAVGGHACGRAAPRGGGGAAQRGPRQPIGRAPARADVAGRQAAVARSKVKAGADAADPPPPGMAAHPPATSGPTSCSRTSGVSANSSVRWMSCGEAACCRPFSSSALSTASWACRARHGRSGVRWVSGGGGRGHKALFLPAQPSTLPFPLSSCPLPTGGPPARSPPPPPKRCPLTCMYSSMTRS